VPVVALGPQRGGDLDEFGVRSASARRDADAATRSIGQRAIEISVTRQFVWWIKNER
jgi:hypothetical protein